MGGGVVCHLIKSLKTYEIYHRYNVHLLVSIWRIFSIICSAIFFNTNKNKRTAYHDLLTPSSEIYVYETLIDFERSVQIFIHSGDSAWDSCTMENESEHLLDRQGNSILPQTMCPVHWTQQGRKSSISAPASQIAQNKQRSMYYMSSDIIFFSGYV